MKGKKDQAPWTPAKAFRTGRYLLLLAVFLLTSLSAVKVHAKVKLNKTELVMEKGSSYQLKVTGTSKKVTWKSSKKKVATVSSKGKVKAKKAGTATVTATVGSKAYKCKVTVYSKEAYRAYKLREYILKKGKKDGSWRYISLEETDESDTSIFYEIYVTKKDIGMRFRYRSVPDTASYGYFLDMDCNLLGDRTCRITYERLDYADDTGDKATADLTLRPEGLMIEVGNVTFLVQNDDGNIVEEEGDEYDCYNATERVEQQTLAAIHGLDALLKKHKMGTMQDLGFQGKMYWPTAGDDEDE